MMDSAESDFFSEGTGDGAMMDPGESGLFIGDGDSGSDSLCRMLSRGDYIEYLANRRAHFLLRYF